MAVAQLAALLGCGGPNTHVDPPSSAELSPGGVYVAYNNGCEMGCDELARGDLIVAVDGRPVQTRADVLSAHLTDEHTVELDVVHPGEASPRHVLIQAAPGRNYPPLEDTPPFWTVGASALDRAPDWARAPMFSHALPAFGFVHVDGGWVTGRDLYGQRSIIVVWPDLPMYDRQYWNFRDQMATFYGVLQKAQHDLELGGVRIVFAVCGGSNDTTVRRELAEMSQVDAQTGEALKPLPIYRCPSLSSSKWAPTAGPEVQAFGDSPARHVGLEHSAQTFWKYARGFPLVVVVDEGGIVRWHSSGYHEGPQNTILGAVMFAMNDLDETPATKLADGGDPRR